jgi:DnaJ-class molecular chaperone
MGKTGSSPDLYDILGVAKDAPAQDIKRAFRGIARACHPDVAGTDPKMAEKFKQAREAYEVLSDPAQRARYDRRGERRTNPFYGSSWNRAGAAVGSPPPAGAGTSGRAGNDLDLEDIFNDFGVGDFGFTGQTRGPPPAAAPGGRPRSGAPETGRFTGRPAAGRAPGGSGGAGSGGAGAGGTGSGGAGSGGTGLGGAGSDRDGFQTSNFGFGGAASARAGFGGGSGSVGGGSAGAGGAGGPRLDPNATRRHPGPQPGRDIAVTVDLPPDVVARGGTVTVAYTRLRRADDGRTLYRYDELHDLKVPPGMRHGDTLRVTGMGDAGLDGGRYGELVADLRVLGGRAVDPRGAAWDPAEEGGEGAARAGAPVEAEGREEGGRRDGGRMKMPSREAAADGVVRVDVGIVTALLGGRVPVETPGGPVRVNIPAGTSSGTRMRLRGRGPVGPDGAATDLVAEVRIVVPKELDAESRALIERFGVLNPVE